MNRTILETILSEEETEVDDIQDDLDEVKDDVEDLEEKIDDIEDDLEEIEDEEDGDEDEDLKEAFDILDTRLHLIENISNENLQNIMTVISLENFINTLEFLKEETDCSLCKEFYEEKIDESQKMFNESFQFELDDTTIGDLDIVRSILGM